MKTIHKKQYYSKSWMKPMHSAPLFCTKETILSHATHSAHPMQLQRSTTEAWGVGRGGNSQQRFGTRRDKVRGCGLEHLKQQNKLRWLMIEQLSECEVPRQCLISLLKWWLLRRFKGIFDRILARSNQKLALSCDTNSGFRCISTGAWSRRYQILQYSSTIRSVTGMEVLNLGCIAYVWVYGCSGSNLCVMVFLSMQGNVVVCP